MSRAFSASLSQLEILKSPKVRSPANFLEPAQVFHRLKFVSASSLSTKTFAAADIRWCGPLSSLWLTFRTVARGLLAAAHSLVCAASFTRGSGAERAERCGCNRCNSCNTCVRRLAHNFSTSSTCTSRASLSSANLGELCCTFLSLLVAMKSLVPLCLSSLSLCIRFEDAGRPCLVILTRPLFAKFATCLRRMAAVRMSVGWRLHFRSEFEVNFRGAPEGLQFANEFWRAYGFANASSIRTDAHAIGSTSSSLTNFQISLKLALESNRQNANQSTSTIQDGRGSHQL